MMRGFTHERAGHLGGRAEWYTPPAIFDALGLAFDLDPASPGANIVPWVPASRHYTIADNGLMRPWEGRVWLNPPYGQHTSDWLQRFLGAGVEGVALVFSRTDTRWFHRLVPRFDAALFVRGRIAFIRSDGASGSGAGAGSLMLAKGRECVGALEASHLGLLWKNSQCGAPVCLAGLAGLP